MVLPGGENNTRSIFSRIRASLFVIAFSLQGFCSMIYTLTSSMVSWRFVGKSSPYDAHEGYFLICLGALGLMSVGFAILIFLIVDAEAGGFPNKYREAVWFQLLSAVMLVCVYVVPLCFACAAFVPATHVRLGYIIISSPFIVVSLLFLTECLIVSYQKRKATIEAKRLAKIEEERRAKAEKEELERLDEERRRSIEMTTSPNLLMV